MKKFICILSTILLFATASGQEYRKDRLFMPKASLGAGFQVSYLDLTSNDSDFMMMLKGIDAQGTYFSVAPYVSYAYRDNKAVGIKFNYAKGSADLSGADLSLFSDDLTMHLEDMSAYSQSYQVQIFHRSFFGLDDTGRFGLFNDMVLSFGDSRSSFLLGQMSLDTYSRTRKAQLGVCPGIMIFILNNISTYVSMSIGGVSYSHTDCIEKGVSVGKRDQMKTHFSPDITGIAFGMTFYLK